jgi:glycosyltransferase involved in cell wall biosynthesis
VPLISVIVPTHKPAFLRETLQSVIAQEFQDFEIVVVPNNGARLNGEVPEDPRIRIVPYDGPSLVGAVKRFAFTQGAGDILVELDHDDLLTPDALGKIAETFDKSQAGFVYSDFAEFRDDGKFTEPFNPFYGWKAMPQLILGKNVTTHEAFEPSPAALGLVHYAPNHVRAWKKNAYKKAGGHDPRLSVCDDHDLLIRTYLTGEMVRIPDCLYLYRIHGKNTWLERNAQIQTETWKLYGKNIEALALRWARQSKLPSIDLNRAYDSTPGWEKAPEADYSGRWPFEDSSIGTFKAYDFLHGLPDKMHAMKELHRCLVPGGWVFTFTPATPSRGAFMDPTTKSYWNKNAFWYWTDKNYARWLKNETTRFQSMRLVEEYPTAWHSDNDIKYVTFDGIAWKDGYDGPGPHQI